MLEINSNDFIYLTKGDSGTINITLQQGYESQAGDNIEFYVRNARNLDNIQFALTSAGEVEGFNNNTYGTITAAQDTTNKWTINIASLATEEMKRGKYVYDIKLHRNDGTISTFLGGGVDKLNFVVT